MVIINIESNTSVGGLTLDPAGMHCPSWDDAFVSSSVWTVQLKYSLTAVVFSRNFILLLHKVVYSRSLGVVIHKNLEKIWTPLPKIMKM